MALGQGPGPDDPARHLLRPGAHTGGPGIHPQEHRDRRRPPPRHRALAGRSGPRRPGPLLGLGSRRRPGRRGRLRSLPEPHGRRARRRGRRGRRPGPARPARRAARAPPAPRRRRLRGPHLPARVPPRPDPHARPGRLPQDPAALRVGQPREGHHAGPQPGPAHRRLPRRTRLRRRHRHLLRTLGGHLVHRRHPRPNPGRSRPAAGPGTTDRAGGARRRRPDRRRGRRGEDLRHPRARA